MGGRGAARRPRRLGSEEASGGAGKTRRAPPIFARDGPKVERVISSRVPRRGRKLAAASGTSAKSIVTGYSNTFAIMDGGSVMCWGRNSNGALGVGSSGGSRTLPRGQSIWERGTRRRWCRRRSITRARYWTTIPLKCWGIITTASWGTATARMLIQPRGNGGGLGERAHGEDGVSGGVSHARYWTTIPLAAGGINQVTASSGSPG